MDVIEVSGEEDGRRGLEHAVAVDNLLEIELAEDVGGVDGFSATRMRSESASCKLVGLQGSRTIALLLLSK